MLKKFSGSILYILISLLVLSLYTDRHQSLERLDLASGDALFMLRGKQEASADIAIVSIDDRALKDVGKWPWNRNKIAYLIDAIAAQKPKTIALNMNFGPNDYQRSAGYDDSLAAAFKRAGNVIIGYHYSQGDISRGSLLPDALANSAYKSIDDPSAFSKYPPLAVSRIFPPDSKLANAAAGLGFVNVDIDQDRIIRRQPLIAGYRGEFFPSFQVAAIANYLGVGPMQLGIDVGNAVTLYARRIPTDQQGQMMINYCGPERTFKFYSFADLIEKRLGLHDLTGKLVLVGFNAKGSTDIYSTPVSHTLTGLELNANILENMLHGSALKSPGGRIDFGIFLLIAIGLFSALVLPKMSLVKRIIVLVLLLVVLLGADYLLFYYLNFTVTLLYPAMEILFFMAAAPIMKTRGEMRSDEDGADDDEVDYESLLSSTGTIPVADRTPRPSSPQYAPRRTQAKAATPSAAPASDTIFDSDAPTRQAPVSRSTIAIMEASTIDHFGRYKILRPIGKGAMGMVYEGLDPAIDRPVALKTIRLDQVADTDEIGELSERLNREAKAAGKLSHPNIVTIYDVGNDGTTQYIAMEYLQGRTLENILKAGLDWDYRTISRVMIQTCEALDYAHENGIVHRDIKPANIMILEDNKVKVMDFGIARVDKSASMTQTGTALGTPNYISPEQLKGHPVDRRSDIFSVGVVFYEVLTREKPFKGDTLSALIYSILHTEPSRPSEINLDIPRIFDKIIAKALVKDPDLRFQRAKDISDVLRKLI